MKKATSLHTNCMHAELPSTPRIISSATKSSKAKRMRDHAVSRSESRKSSPNQPQMLRAKMISKLASN